MAWLQQLQTVVTIATGALAAWVGYQQFQLTQRVEEQKAEIAQLNAQLEVQRVELARQAELRLQEEQERRFNFDVFKLAIDSLKASDPELQRALVAYFRSLSDGAFRRQMLVLFRSESEDPVAAKTASRELGREIEVLQAQLPQPSPAWSPPGEPAPGGAPEPAAEAPAPAPAPVLPAPPPAAAPPAERGPAARLVSAGRAEGWDYDLFVCSDASAGAPVEPLLAALQDFDPRHGRIRLEPLEESLRSGSLELATPGLFLLIDRDAAAEVEQGEGLRRALEAQGFDFEARANPGPASPWYISLFYCPA